MNWDRFRRGLPQDARPATALHDESRMTLRAGTAHRIKTEAEASGAMTLSAVPPSMRPILIVDFPRTGSRAQSTVRMSWRTSSNSMDRGLSEMRKGRMSRAAPGFQAQTQDAFMAEGQLVFRRLADDDKPASGFQGGRGLGPAAVRFLPDDEKKPEPDESPRPAEAPGRRSSSPRSSPWRRRRPGRRELVVLPARKRVGTVSRWEQRTTSTGPPAEAKIFARPGSNFLPDDSEALGLQPSGGEIPRRRFSCPVTDGMSISRSGHLNDIHDDSSILRRRDLSFVRAGHRRRNFPTIAIFSGATSESF